jgi:hypothetical protein
MPKPSIVILSEAKNLRQKDRSFALLRMTVVGYQLSNKKTEAAAYWFYHPAAINAIILPGKTSPFLQF